jgi:hypothetical protein
MALDREKRPSMKKTVFYSWQSDLPNNTNRGFIETALDRAVKSIAADDSIQVEPVIASRTSRHSATCLRVIPSSSIVGTSFPSETMSERRP